MRTVLCIAKRVPGTVRLRKEIHCGLGQKLFRFCWPITNTVQRSGPKCLLALLARHQHNEAVQALERAAELQPDLDEAHFKLGVAYKSLGRHGQAIEALERAAELKPGFAGAYSSLGNVYAATGELEQAEAAYRQAVEVDPGYDLPAGGGDLRSGDGDGAA